MTRSILLRFAPLILLLLTSCAAPKTAPAVLTISPNPQQTILGWGIYPCTIQNDRKDAKLYTLWKRPNAARLIWRDLNATYWRSEITPGSYDAKHDDGSLDVEYLDESLVRQIKLARSFGKTRYILSVWSPPAPFKSPAATRGTAQKPSAPPLCGPNVKAIIACLSGRKAAVIAIAPTSSAAWLLRRSTIRSSIALWAVTRFMGQR